jgi:hypothetical protein
MRTIFTALLFTTTAFAGYCPFELLSFTKQPTLIDAARTASITNGVTLGLVVTNLGPGWIMVDDGFIRWSFTDGRELQVRPFRNTADEVLHTNVSEPAYFWFTTNANKIASK